MNRNEYRYGAPAGEKPLEHMVTDGGFASIFRTIACVGDSLSSGEFETHDPVTGETTGYHDMFPYSWGQFLARMTGATVHNFSGGGMMASTYCEAAADACGWWNPDLKAQAYIIALGVNDIVNFEQEPGTVADICPDDPTQNAKTFMGYYARIIQTYKKISPDAKFFLVTAPIHPSHKRMGLADRFVTVLDCVYALAEYFGAYVIDLYRYAPAHEGEYVDNFYLYSHLNPMGYRVAAEQMASYIDYIIRHNPADFKNIGFICNEKPYFV